MFVSDRIVPFPKGYNFFQQHLKKPVKIISTTGSTDKSTTCLFPSLGPLISYLLSADLVYTGVFSPPTMDDIAYIIRNINHRAAAALEDLGYIKRDHKSNQPKLEECKAGVQTALQAVLDVVPENL